MRTCCFWIIGDERERNRIICRHPRFLNEKYTEVTIELAFSFFLYKISGNSFMSLLLYPTYLLKKKNRENIVWEKDEQ